MGHSAPRYYLLPGVGFGVENKQNKQAVPVSLSISELKRVAVIVSQFIAGKEASDFAPSIVTQAQGLFDLWLEMGGETPLFHVARHTFGEAYVSDPPRIKLDLNLLCESTQGLRDPDLTPDVCQLKITLEKHGFQLQANIDIDFPSYVFRLGVVETPVVRSREQGVIAEGKGFSASVSELGALAEAIERIMALNPDYSRIIGNSSRKMKESGCLIPRIEPGDRDMYTDELYIDWVSAYMYPNLPAWIPAEKAWHIYPPLSGIYAFDMRTTIGLAAGNSVTEAFANGLLESVERDAYAVVMRCKLECPAVTNDEIDACGPEVTALIKELDKKGIDIHIKWISIDWPVPIAHVLLLDRGDRIPAHSHGCSAAISPTVAITRALLESVQVHEGLARVATENWNKIATRIERNHSQPRVAWSDPLFRPNLAHLVNRSSSYSINRKMEHVKNIGELCDWLMEHEHRIFWAHLGNAGGLDVVRVYVENVVMPDSRLEYFGNRLKQWIKKLGIPSPYTDPILT